MFDRRAPFSVGEQMTRAAGKVEGADRKGGSNHRRPCAIGAIVPRRLLWATLLGWSLAKTWLTFTRYLNQDEFESLHQGWLLYSGAIQYRDFNSNHPPLAFQLLGLLNYLSDHPVAVIILARLLTLIAAGFVLFLVYSIGRSVYGDGAGRWAVVVFAVNATILEWSTEVRTDFLIVPLWLAGIAILLAERPRSQVARMVIVGLLFGTAFWTNQKSVLHMFPVGLFMLLGGPRRQLRFPDVAISLAASLIPGIWVLGSAWWNGSFVELLQCNFTEAWRLKASGTYDRWRVTTSMLAVRRDFGFVVLSIACLVGQRYYVSTREQKFLFLASIWMIVTFFLTPGPFPYYLQSVYPLLAVNIGGLLMVLSSRFKNWSHRTLIRRRLLMVTVGIAFAAFPAVRLARLVVPTSWYQLRALNIAHALVPAGSRVFDGAGTFFNRPDAYPYHWVLWKEELRAYLQGEIPPLLPALKKHRCKLVIDTYRLRALPTRELIALRRQFVPVWGPR